ncbi:hypothetical protein LguiB_001674 [Lonicera macranthoides]
MTEVAHIPGRLSLLQLLPFKKPTIIDNCALAGADLPSWGSLRLCSDVIRPNSSFYSTMMVHGIPNDDPHMMNRKDRAWKFKRNSIEFHMLDFPFNSHHTSSPLRAKLALEIVKPPPPSSAVSSFAASDAPPPPIHLPFLPLQPPFFLYSRRRTSADAPSPPISLPLPFLQVPPSSGGPGGSPGIGPPLNVRENAKSDLKGHKKETHLSCGVSGGGVRLLFRGKNRNAGVVLLREQLDALNEKEAVVEELNSMPSIDSERNAEIICG